MSLFGPKPGSPEWYYERYPGFYNEECYEILSSWDKGVPPAEEDMKEDDRWTSPNEVPIPLKYLRSSSHKRKFKT